MNTILKINGDPPIRTYQVNAYPLGVLLSNPDRITWILNHFIQLIYIKDNSELEDDMFRFQMYAYQIWPIIKCQSVYISDLYEENIDILQFIKSVIDQGYVVGCMIDEYFVENRNAYKKNHIQHDILIFGYDEDKSVFHIIGYTNKKKYEKTTSGMFDFLNGISINMASPLWLYKDSEIQYLMQPKLIIDGIEKYITSSCEQHNYSFAAFGLEACKLLADRINMIALNNRIFDIQPLHLFLEHKKVMLMRIQYFNDIYHLEINRLIEEYDHLVSSSLLIRNLGLKYRFTNNPQNLLDAEQILRKLILKEKKLLSSFLEKLNCSHSI